MDNATSAQKYDHIHTQPLKMPRKSTTTPPNGSLHSHPPSHSMSKVNSNGSPTTSTKQSSTNATCNMNPSSSLAIPGDSTSTSGNSNFSSHTNEHADGCDIGGGYAGGEGEAKERGGKPAFEQEVIFSTIPLTIGVESDYEAGAPQTNATVAPSTSTQGREMRVQPSLPVDPDETLWAHSSVGESADDVPRPAERVFASPGSGGHAHGDDGWTSEIPEALLAAAAQEEGYHLAQAQYGHGSGQHIVPEPSIPPAPNIPRHLERLILNRPGVGSGSSMNAGGAAVSPALRVTTASGTDVSVPMMSSTSAATTHSVLQTPSHAVLYHLCTTSIRDKMIAIGCSTRYRQKYFTTVYYKPAESAATREG